MSVARIVRVSTLEGVMGMSVRTWQDNAREFRALTKQGYGVRLGLLAACSIEPVGAGDIAGDGSSGRVSATAFAQAAGVSISTVLAHLKKWDRMVEAGWDVPRADLDPALADVLDLPAGFVSEYEELTEERGAYRHLSRAGMADAIRTDPQAAEAAARVLLNQPERLVAAATSQQLDQVSDAVIARTLADAGHPPAQRRQKPGSPGPEWDRLVTRIGTDAMAVTAMIRTFREDGRDDLADWCGRELRQALLEAITALESLDVPDTAADVSR